MGESGGASAATGAAAPVDFSPYTTLHLIAVVVAVALIAGLAVTGRRVRSSPRTEWSLRLAWGLSILGAQVVTIAWWMLPAHFDPGVSFPLHVCDLAAILAVPALLLEARWLRTILYFWGLGLSTQAFLTPVITVGPGATEFWLFWIQHTQIAGSGVYLVAVLGYRPRLHDVAVMIGVSAAYIALVLAVNIPFELNYGYLGEISPEQPTLIDRLGQWPLRLIPLLALGLGAYVLLWVVWPLGHRIRGVLAGGS